MQLTDTSVYLKEEQTMWHDISPVWQTAFSEMWKSFCAGSPPIGAALCDADGKVILYDHNRNNEPQTSNRRISHAEVNILSRLDTSVFNSRTLTLYSTMEPYGNDTDDEFKRGTFSRKGQLLRNGTSSGKRSVLQIKEHRLYI